MYKEYYDKFGHKSRNSQVLDGHNTATTAKWKYSTSYHWLFFFLESIFSSRPMIKSSMKFDALPPVKPETMLANVWNHRTKQVGFHRRTAGLRMGRCTVQGDNCNICKCRNNKLEDCKKTREVRDATIASVKMDVPLTAPSWTVKRRTLAVWTWMARCRNMAITSDPLPTETLARVIVFLVKLKAALPALSLHSTFLGNSVHWRLNGTRN